MTAAPFPHLRFMSAPGVEYVLWGDDERHEGDWESYFNLPLALVREMEAWHDATQALEGEGPPDDAGAQQERYARAVQLDRTGYALYQELAELLHGRAHVRYKCATQTVADEIQGRT